MTTSHPTYDEGRLLDVVHKQFDRVQNTQKLFWSEEDINNKLDSVMTRAFRDVLALATDSGVSMRTAAYMLALERVATAKRVRGVFP
jgi:glutamate dehydrogenase/leucine dehydrogenase